MAESLTIRKLIDKVSAGDIRIPAFQRGYVWTPTQVAFLLDSLYKEYPVGTIFLWKTSERLKTEKDLGDFTLPDPQKDYPVNYVLDGQQRITSIFSVFQSELAANNDSNWIDIYFDFEGSENVQESRFLALTEDEVDSNKHFPIKTLFDSVEYRKSTSTLSKEKIELIDKVQEKFKEVILPIQVVETDDKAKVAIVFERINRAGTELDTYQLLTAWSWSNDFDLQEEFELLSAELEPFGFGNISEDKDLQLKCCSGVISGQASPKSIMELNGEDVRTNFVKIKNGIKGAIDFLQKELNVFSLKTMPYPAMLVALTRFFSSDRANGRLYTEKQRKQLIKWFWKSNLSRRYTGGITDKHRLDMQLMDKLISDEETDISPYALVVESSFFTKSQFNLRSVNAKTFILMLSSKFPKSFISGANVDLKKVLSNVNKTEFHHIFPKKHLERQGLKSKEINMLPNICFLNNADNQKIKDNDPKVYKKLIDSEAFNSIMDSGLIPRNGLDFPTIVYT